MQATHRSWIKRGVHKSDGESKKKRLNRPRKPSMIHCRGGGVVSDYFPSPHPHTTTANMYSHFFHVQGNPRGIPLYSQLVCQPTNAEGWYPVCSVTCYIPLHPLHKTQPFFLCVSTLLILDPVGRFRVAIVTDLSGCVSAVRVFPPLG